LGDVLQVSMEPIYLTWHSFVNTRIAQRHETRIIEHSFLHPLTPHDLSTCPEQQGQEHCISLKTTLYMYIFLGSTVDSKNLEVHFYLPFLDVCSDNPHLGGNVFCLFAKSLD
jgi:hypothetical protein